MTDCHITENIDLLRKILEASGDIGFIYDLDIQEIEWIGDVHALLKMPVDQNIFFSDIKKIINPQDLPNRLQKTQMLLIQGEGYHCDYRLRLPDGTTMWLHEVMMPHHIKEIDKTIYYGVLRDVTQERDALEDLKAIAYINLETHAPNFEGFKSLLEQEMDYARQSDEIGTLFCVGIDRIGVIEEAYDSKATEQVFKSVVKRLEEFVGRDGTVGVLSGHSFGILWPKLDEEKRRYKAFEIIKSFSNIPVMTKEGPIRVTLSIGGVEYPKADLSAHSLLQRARTTLEEACDYGQSAYKSYDYLGAEKEAFKHWIVTSDDFVDAMNDGRISVAFQAVMDTKADEVLFYETLIRMIDRNGTIVPAAMFMPAIEKMGLCRFADSIALKHVVEELKNYPDIKLSVNISVLSMRSDEWMGQARELLKDHKEIANRLIIEITETAAMTDLEHANDFIKQLHELGCLVALDDFGAGHTSFSHLPTLDIDMVKIDGDFVKVMSERQENKFFVKAMQVLSQGFGIPMIVEGVEDKEIAALLQSEGIYNLQGFAYSIPTLERLWVEETNEQRLLINR